MDKPDSNPAWDQRQLQDMLATVLDHVGAAIYMKDVDGCYRYGNRMTFEHFGLPREAVIGKRDRDLLPAGFAAEIEHVDRQVIESGVPQRCEETLPDATGAERHYWSVKVPLVREGDQPLLVGFSTDITVLHQLRMELHRQSITDDLSGLCNRRFLFETLNKELSRARRQKLHTTLLLIDLDHFKRVNDRFGHPVGDRVLQEFSRMLQGSVRIEDTAARVGGDEFAVLLPDSDPDAAMTTAERIRAKTAELQLVADSGELFGITVSIGLVHVHEGAGTPDTLYAEADQLLYRAKQAGRNRIGRRGG
jgi:diguanylate cyclase (GGDEF)-like protein/PAS domain S-box-containing protein